MMNVMVSICVVTYQHAKYIRQALDSFLAQKCDFDFEILIHDDASTDGAADIIAEYEQRYPDKIRAILQKENQYSQGITNISGAFNFPRARGKYIALCDGDDYWCDENKLAIQVAYMEKHLDCMLCVHSAKVVNDNGDFIDRNLMRPYQKNTVLSPKQVLDKKGAFAFGSMLLRKEVVEDLPRYYVDCPVGDRPLELMAIERGNVYYIDRPMSAYRFNGAGSWTSSMKSGDYQRKQEVYARQMSKMYKEFDQKTNCRFHREAVLAAHRLFFLTRVNLRDFTSIYQPKHRRFYRELPRRERFFIAFEYRLPTLYRLMQNWSHKMRNSHG